MSEKRKEAQDMIPRERIEAMLNHEEADRVPIHDSPWMASVDRWHEEGLPADVNPAEYFDYEIVCFRADTSPRFPVKVVDETEEYIIHTTPYGGVRRDHKDFSTTPGILDYPCKSRGDWEGIKGRLLPDKDRVDWKGDWLSSFADDNRNEASTLQKGRKEWRLGLPGCERAREQGRFTCYSSGVGYDKAQSYLGTERLLIAIATEPDWVRDIYEIDANLVIQMYEMMKQGGFKFDGVWLFSDLGYRNGLLFSPRHFNEQLRPTFKKLFDYFRGEGLPVILHSCGCVRDLIPFFIEDGLTCLQPLEVKAGMDLIELKKVFGDQIAFMGGIDVRAMANPDPSVIEDEIQTKISFAKKGGGYIYHSDHSVPNDVSFERYIRVLELVRKYGAY
jgi:uroporphyrinogen decarboxylase